MEDMLKQWVKTLDLRSESGKRVSPANRANTLGVIRYADDFVVLHKDLNVVNGAREQVQQWLAHMGLELKDSKTRLVHTDKAISDAPAGFDFLGFSIRRYSVGKYSRGKRGLDAKTLIKPSKDAITKHLNHIKSKLKDLQLPANVVNTLNPIIRGWCNYYKTVVSKRIYNICRQSVYTKLLAWAKRKHAYRSRQWVYKKYYVRVGQRLKFSADGTSNKVLMCHDETKIVRHVKVKGSSSVYDGNDLYWSNRLAHFNGLNKRETRLLQVQQGLCYWCGGRLNVHDMLEVDHKTPKAKGGADTWTNLQLLHSYCHDAKHA
jgi:RNA-directed DNA polymerase